MVQHIYGQKKLKVLDHHYPIPSVFLEQKHAPPQPYKPNHQNTKTPTTRHLSSPLSQLPRLTHRFFGGHAAIWSGWTDGCLRSGSIPNLTQRCTWSFSKRLGGLGWLVGWIGWLAGNFGHLASGLKGGLSKLHSICGCVD